MATLITNLCRAGYAGEVVNFALHDAVQDHCQSFPRIMQGALAEVDYYTIIANVSPCKDERYKAAKAIRVIKKLSHPNTINRRKLNALLSRLRLELLVLKN